MEFLPADHKYKRDNDDSENSAAMLIARSLGTGRSPDECKVDPKGNEPAGNDELDPAMKIAKSLSDPYTPTDTRGIMDHYVRKPTGKSSRPR